MKNQKGITLIALIITIIIMLILVGVSVSISLNGGLFNTAKQASKGTEEKRDEELALSDGKVNVNGKLYNSMDEYVNGAKWTQNETTVTKGDVTLEIGQIVTGYDAGVEGWDGEWAVLGVEDGKLLLVSTKSVAYEETTDEYGTITKTYGAGTVYYTDASAYMNSLQNWCNSFKSELAESIRPLSSSDVSTFAGVDKFADYIGEYTDSSKLSINLGNHVPTELLNLLYPSNSNMICLTLDEPSFLSYYVTDAYMSFKSVPILTTQEGKRLLQASPFWYSSSSYSNRESDVRECRAVVTLNPDANVNPDDRINSES